MKVLGFFIKQQINGSYQPQFEPQILNQRKVIFGNPVTAFGMQPPLYPNAFVWGNSYALIDPESARVVPMMNYVTPQAVANNLAAAQASLQSGISSGVGNQVGNQPYLGSQPAASALNNISLAPSAPAGCSSCGESAASQINGVTPAPQSSNSVTPTQNQVALTDAQKNFINGDIPNPSPTAVGGWPDWQTIQNGRAAAQPISNPVAPPVSNPVAPPVSNPVAPANPPSPWEQRAHWLDFLKKNHRFIQS
jgi:hypothetical protein